MNNLSRQKCVPCEVGGIPLSEQESLNELKNLPGWTLEKNSIRKEFTFKDFSKAMKYVNFIAAIAEEQNHHPDIFISYNKVTITLTTHAIQGLSINDFIIASKIEEIKVA